MRYISYILTNCLGHTTPPCNNSFRLTSKVTNRFGFLWFSPNSLMWSLRRHVTRSSLLWRTIGCIPSVVCWEETLPVGNSCFLESPSRGQNSRESLKTVDIFIYTSIQNDTCIFKENTCLQNDTLSLTFLI